MACRRRRRAADFAMMRALLAKELRALRPLACCIAGLFALTLLYLFATELPDAQPLNPQKWLNHDRAGAFFMLTLFGLMIGAGSLIHESEQGTLRFLDGLPLSRSRLFAAKVLAAFAVIALVPILGLSADSALGLISRSSIDPAFPWAFLFAQLGLEMLVGAYVVAIALVLSFLRKWFALAAGLLLFGGVIARTSGVHWVALLDPYQMLGVGLDGSRVLVPWRHVAAHAGATLVLLAGAWVGFLHLGDRAQFAGEWLGRWRVLRLLGTTVRFLAPVIWIASIVKLVDKPPPPAASSGTPLGETVFAQQDTTYYEFLFRSVQREQAAPLIAQADAIFGEVWHAIGAPPPPSRIVVDLASPVMPHIAGMTNWTKIRLPIALSPDLADQRLILGHETTHVFIEQLSDGRLSGHFRYIRFLHEGLATHVEQQLFAEPSQRMENRRSVAAAWTRGTVPFELLSDDGELRRKRDPNLAYPLGEVFARVLIDAHGREAPAKLLRAFGRKNAPTGLAGTALWRDTMQAAGLSLDRAVAGYESACATIAEEEKAFVEKLPRVTATVAVESGEIVIRPKFDGAEPGELICMIDVEDPLKMDMPDVPRRADGTFALPRQRVSKPTLRYLLGWRTPETRLPVFEPWAETAL
jgi:hypothetical protein